MKPLKIFYIKKNLNFTLDTSYFQFVDTDNQSLKELNFIVAGKSAEGIVGFRSYILEDNDFYTENSKHTEVENWYYSNHFSIHFLNSSFISFTENIYSYIGGAHGSMGVIGHNYYIAPSFKLNIEHIFDLNDKDKVLKLISDFCYNELRNIYNESFEIDDDEIQKQDKSMFWEHSLESRWENFNNYVISKDFISIIFNQYQVSSYAFGIQIIDIPFTLLESLDINLTKLEKLRNLIKYNFLKNL